VDEVWADLCSWDNELVFAVWTDARAGAGGSQETAAGAVYFGSFPTADGRQLAYRGETTDGRTGKVVLGGKRYDLAGGSLFLVATRGKQPRALQLKRDIRKADPERFKEMARTDAAIAEFFAGGAGQTPEGK
jgi:hypothetical protein